MSLDVVTSMVISERATGTTPDSSRKGPEGANGKFRRRAGDVGRGQKRRRQKRTTSMEGIGPSVEIRLRSGYDLDSGVLVDRDAAELAVVLGEVDDGDEDVVFGNALGGDARGEGVQRAEFALDHDGPRLAA